MKCNFIFSKKKMMSSSVCPLGCDFHSAAAAAAVYFVLQKAQYLEASADSGIEPRLGEVKGSFLRERVTTKSL
jgi:hypothetical protein